jgi:enolase-phosphatase E1
VTVQIARDRLDAIVLDIEGTTTPVAFVTGVLFPYARHHLRQHLAEQRNSDELRHAAGLLREEWAQDVASGEAPPSWIDGSDEALAAYVEWLMDRDRKTTGLKLLQGHIWAGGYTSGHLQGQVFSDVVPALTRWQAAGLTLAIYSSGSAQGQRLLFAHTPAGDLTPYFAMFFDTTVGAKISAESYRRIGYRLGCATDRLLFVSDVSRETNAAAEAGCQVALVARESAATREYASRAPIVRSLDEIAVA